MNGSSAVLTPSLEEVNNHRHFGTGQMWQRQSEVAHQTIAITCTLETFWGVGRRRRHEDDEQDLFHNGVQTQCALSEEEES
jgi:hypothetical protein